LRADSEELEAGSTGTSSPRSGYDFSRFPIHPPAYILGRDRLLRPNKAEVVVQLRDGTGDIIRVDRVVSEADQGVLLEIKPAGRSAEKGRAQLPGRLEALQKEFPKKNGWRGEVVEYTRADVEAWLRAEGVPAPNIPKILRALGF
jgi:hypothetical protein